MDDDLDVSDVDETSSLGIQLNENKIEDEVIKAHQIEEQLLLDEAVQGDDLNDEQTANDTEEEDTDDHETDDEYIDDLDEDIDLVSSVLNSNDIVSVHETYSEYYASAKITSPFLTKFERAKVLGVRAQMLASGAEPMISPPFPEECYNIALMELKEKKIPLIIRRYLPNKKFEDWRLEDLIIKNV